MHRLAALAVTVALLVACGVDPAKVTPHALYAKEGDTIEAGESLTFAVVGDTRTVLPSDVEPAAATIADIGSEAALRELSFVVLTGDYVRRSSTGEWTAFAESWKEVLKSDLLSNNKNRRKVAPLPGSQELIGDKKLEGYGAAFEGVGAPIGFGRTASWFHFDAKVDGKTWRLVFLDSHADALGSRWQEQVFWLPKVVSGDDFDHLIVFLPDPLVTLSEGGSMDPDDGPSSLLAIVDDNAGLMKLMAVISGGAGTNEAYLPTGPFGEAYLVAGNAGTPSPGLARTGDGEPAGFEALELEPSFDAALMRRFDFVASTQALPEKTVQRAKAEGDFAGKPGVYDGDAFPVQGWWIVTLQRSAMRATFRMRQADGTFADVYQLKYTKKDGWTATAL